jgi:hypothetical protein
VHEKRRYCFSCTNENNVAMKFSMFAFLTVKHSWLQLRGSSLFHATNILLGPGNFGA